MLLMPVVLREVVGDVHQARVDPDDLQPVGLAKSESQCVELPPRPVERVDEIIRVLDWHLAAHPAQRYRHLPLTDALTESLMRSSDNSSSVFRTPCRRQSSAVLA
jgi:hypothetical protein